MTPAAVYARFSSDLQEDRSIDDQVAACRGYAERHGFEIVAVYDDRAISGATFAARAGLQRLLADLPSQRFSAVITESLSRISRDQADTHVIGKEFDYHDCKLITLGDGEVTGMIRGLRAIINEQQLADIRLMTRRGLAARIAEGRSAGGVMYGYDVAPGAERGHRTINPAEAEVVRRIFRRYLEGASHKVIATELNADGVPAPRSRFWRANTIGGNGRRGNGILQNEIYAGVLVWNRVRMVRNPRSRRRISRPNPEKEWKRQPVPELAIIERDVWDAVQAQRQARTCAGPARRAKPARMLSGLLRCGACGAGMPSIGEDKSGRLRIRCAGATQGGICDHGRRYYLQPIERAVAGALRNLGSPEAVALYAASYHDELRRIAGDDPRPRLRSALSAVEAELARAVDLTLRGIVTEAEAAPRLGSLRAERDRLVRELAAHAPHRPRVDVNAAARFRASLTHLEETINDAIMAGEREVADTLRQMIDKVEVTPTPAGQRPRILVTGHLDALICSEDAQTIPRTVAGGLAVAGEALGLAPRLRLLPFSFDIAA